MNDKYNGDFPTAFKAFDKNKDGNIDKNELKPALKAMGVGNGFTRSAWVDGIVVGFVFCQV